MSAPFRELFVELPRAVFEVLQGIGERAASNGLAKLHRDLYPAPSLTAVRLALLHEERFQRVICERYRWTRVRVHRSAVQPATTVIGAYACGHTIWIRLDEDALDRAPEPMVAIRDEIDSAVNRRARCYCVPRPRG